MAGAAGPAGAWLLGWHTIAIEQPEQLLGIARQGHGRSPARGILADTAARKRDRGMQRRSGAKDCPSTAAFRHLVPRLLVA